MAYIDKVTTMRRMALISGPGTSGVIVWEGVNIEGTCVLRHVHSPSEEFHNLLTMPEEDLDGYCGQEDLVAVYQDPEDQEYWEPRADQPPLTNSKKGEYESRNLYSGGRKRSGRTHNA